MNYDVYYNNKINMARGFNTDQCLYDLGFDHMEASFSPEGPKSFFFTPHSPTYQFKAHAWTVPLSQVKSHCMKSVTWRLETTWCRYHLIKGNKIIKANYFLVDILHKIWIISERKESWSTWRIIFQKNSLTTPTWLSNLFKISNAFSWFWRDNKNGETRFN